MASFIDTNVPQERSLMMSLPIRTQFTTAANEITQLQNRVSVLEQAPGGGDTNWGDITGSIRDQPDLYDWLNELQPMLISGQNIVTINGYNLLGSGNIDLATGGADLGQVYNWLASPTAQPVGHIALDRIPTIPTSHISPAPITQVNGGGGVTATTANGVVQLGWTGGSTNGGVTIQQVNDWLNGTAAPADPIAVSRLPVSTINAQIDVASTTGSLPASRVTGLPSAGASLADVNTWITGTGAPTGTISATRLPSIPIDTGTTGNLPAARITGLPPGGETFTGGQVGDLQLHTPMVAPNLLPPRLDFRAGTTLPVNFGSLGQLRFQGWTSANTWQEGGTITVQAVTGWGPTARDSQMILEVTNGVLPRRSMVLNSDGGVIVGSASGAAPTNGQINVTGVRINGQMLWNWLASQPNPWE